MDGSKMTKIEHMQIRVGLPADEAKAFATMLGESLANRLDQVRFANSREQISISVQSGIGESTTALVENIVAQILLELEGS